MISLKGSRLFSLVVIGVGVTLALATCLLVASPGVSSERLADEYIKKGNKAFIDGDYDQAIVFLAEAVALAPGKKEASERLKMVVEQKKSLENSSSYKEFMRSLNESESEKTKQFMERIQNTQEILQIENRRKMLELKLENEKTLSEALARQDAIIEEQNRRVERMRMITSFGFLVMGIFVILNIYLLVYIFRRPLGSSGGEEKVVDIKDRRRA